MRLLFNSLAILKSKKNSMMCVFLCMIVNLLFSYLLPIITQHLFDYGFYEREMNEIIICSCLIFGIYLGQSIISVWGEKIRIDIYNYLYSKLSADALEKLSKIRFSFFMDRSATDIYHVLDEDINCIANIASSESFGAFTAIFGSIGGFVALCSIDWKLCIPILMTVPFNILITIWVLRKNISIIHKSQSTSQRYSKGFDEFVNASTDIRLWGIVEKKLSELKSNLTEYLFYEKKRSLLFCCNMQIQVVLYQLLLSILYILSGVLLIKNEVSIGAVFAFQSFALVLVSSLSLVVELVLSISSFYPSLKRYYGFMSENIEEDSNQIEAKMGDIVFENVSFGYIEANEIFKNVNVRINCGDKRKR